MTVWTQIPIESREMLREALEGYYGPLGSFDSWTADQVWRLFVYMNERPNIKEAASNLLDEYLS